MSARRIAVVSLALWSSEAAAFQPSTSHWDPAQLPIGYRVNVGTAPASLGAAAARAAVDNGFAAWAAPPCTTWRAQNLGDSSTAPITTGDREVTILWISSGWPAELGDVNQVIGVTTPVWRQGGYVFDADIQFNAVGFRWSTTGQSGTVDTQSIATHEEGHLLGLDHTRSQGAVMLASYGGGLVRTLAPDDVNGVCAVYPSGGPRPDGGVATDPCAQGSSSCSACTPQNDCGWCGASSECQTGTSGGPTMGACAGGWIWQPSDCGGGSDPCASASACDACTPLNGCGWCENTGVCQRGSSTGPSAGVCGDWKWLQMECAGTSGGNRMFGESCASSTECASGLCVQTPSEVFCTRVCTDDCTCPRDYACVQASSGVRVCAPGTNRCSMSMPDAGPPAGDAESAAPDAAGAVGDDASGGASPDASSDPGATPGGRTLSRAGDGCSASGAPTAATLGALALAALVARRRRPRG